MSWDIQLMDILKELFFSGIYTMQIWTTNMRHGGKGKEEKDENHIEKQIRIGP